MQILTFGEADADIPRETIVLEKKELMFMYPFMYDQYILKY